MYSVSVSAYPGDTLFISENETGAQLVNCSSGVVFSLGNVKTAFFARLVGLSPISSKPATNDRIKTGQ